MTRKMLYREIPEVRRRLLSDQEGKCELCEGALSDSDAALDHDHKTGAIRAALHKSCNGAEGKIYHWVRFALGKKKSHMSFPDFLRSLAVYWEKHDEEHHGLIHPTHGKKKTRRKRK